MEQWVNPQSISSSEDQMIKNWVNQQYNWYSEAYKQSAYKDAYNAVLQKKAENYATTQKENARKQKAALANYSWSDKLMKEKSKLAKAEMAVSDAADIIRLWQKANGAKVDNNLTDKQLVDSFLLANNWQPFAEYVSKYLNSHINDNGSVSNTWLAAKLWLDTGTTMWVSNTDIINTVDKAKAYTKWSLQGMGNLLQNTLWAGMNYIGSNVIAWLWELWYSAAKWLWADVSKWTVWDKLKEWKWYTWREAMQEASSKPLMQEWVLSEDQRAYDLWEKVSENAAEIAVTAPLELWAATKIAWSTLPWVAKFWLQAVNGWLWWVWFQALDDASRGELSSANDYKNAALLWAWTAWFGNMLWAGKKLWNKLLKEWNSKVLWAKWQVKTAIETLSPEEYARRDKIAEAYDKNINEKVTPITEIDKTIREAQDMVYNERLRLGKELEKARNWIKFKWKSRSKNERFDRIWVINSINGSLDDLAKKSKYGNKAKSKDLIPHFELKDWKLEMTKDWIAELNKFSRNANWRDVNLWDAIQDAYNAVYWMWGKNNATNTDAFIHELNRIFDKWWAWWNTNMLSVVKKWVKNASEKFDSTITEETLKKLKEAREADRKIITLDDNFENMYKDSADWVKSAASAYKSLKWWAAQEELFKQVKDITAKQWKEIDLNNDILSWAKIVSMRDSAKWKDLINVFYPSKAWVIETWIKMITEPFQRKAVKYQVEKAANSKAANSLKKSSQATPNLNLKANMLWNSLNKRSK